MPAVIASRARDMAQSTPPTRDAQPPTKKAKLTQPDSAPRPNGLAALLNGKSGTKPQLSAKINGSQSSRKDRVDDAKAVVRGGPAGHGDVDMADVGTEVIEISSGDDSSDYSSSDDENLRDAEPGASTGNAARPLTNGHAETEPQPLEDGAAEPEEPTFGERLEAELPEADGEKSRAPRVVDVDAAFVHPGAESRELADTALRGPLATSATSLVTVLSQSLRTNDQDLLDSCLRVSDVDTVYATIERLPSPLVSILLQKLAERLHKRPGRPGMLMVWVQWSLSAHGGYLATQPQLVKQLATLNKVLKERASGLQPLLSLKGRLDMLHTQLELRRRNQKNVENDEIDEPLIYVEGEEEPSSADESDSEGNHGQKRLRDNVDDEDDVSSIDQMPTTMEMDEDSEEGSDGSDELIDDEAEETDNDSGDELSEPMSDDINEDGASGSEEDSRPARRSTAGRGALSRRG